MEAAIPIVGGILGLVLGFGKGRSAETTRRVLRWLSPMVVLFGIFLLACNGASDSAETMAAGMKAKMKLPFQVDADTRLDDVRAISGTELGYFLTITTMTKSDLAANPIGERLEELIRGGACQNPDYLTILKAGISLQIVYQTRDDAEIARITIAPRDCGV